MTIATGWAPRLQEQTQEDREGFDTLAARIEATGDESGLALVAAQRDYMDRATCSPCGRRAAEARLRMWLAKREEPTT